MAAQPLRQWFGFVFALCLLGALPALWDFRSYLFPPPPSYAVVVLGALAVAQAILMAKDPTRREKALWLSGAFLLMFSEMWAVSRDRTEQTNRFAHMTDDLNTTLEQTMGGFVFPMFLPMPPINHSDSMWPVLIMTPGKAWEQGHIPTSMETAPLVDVTVDISEIPQPDFKNMTVSAEAFESQFLPQRYGLGTIMVPQTRTAPFKLESGKNYSLLITTRRKVFWERIYFDRDEKAIGGWSTTECVSEEYTLYGHPAVTSGYRLIEGKCEN
jgi:hypothetical protein